MYGSGEDFEIWSAAGRCGFFKIHRPLPTHCKAKMPRIKWAQAQTGAGEGAVRVTSEEE